MSDKNYGKKAFEKAFKKTVPNFNELICHFEHASRSYEASTIVFVWKNRLWRFKMYRHDYSINKWANHFIEFFETGEFDYNAYWKFYDTKTVAGGKTEQFWVDDVIYSAPLCMKFGSDFYEHSEEFSQMCRHPHFSKVGKQYGIQTVSKEMIKDSVVKDYKEYIN